MSNNGDNDSNKNELSKINFDFSSEKNELEVKEEK